MATEEASGLPGRDPWGPCHSEHHLEGEMSIGWILPWPLKLTAPRGGLRPEEGQSRSPHYMGMRAGVPGTRLEEGIGRSHGVLSRGIN